MENSLLHQWNPAFCGRSVHLLDETLRDGLQSPSVQNPPLSAKIELLHAIDSLGISFVNVGMPSASKSLANDAKTLLAEISNHRLQVRPVVSARTSIGDIDAALLVADDAGLMPEITLFIGSSPIRKYVQHWELAHLQRVTRDSVRYACDHGARVCFVAEDTSRSTPDTLRALYLEALDAGATRLCLADTVGALRPEGVHALTQFVLSFCDDREIGIDWHGHNDRGLALANALAAIDAGCDRIHGTALGIGERVGNPAIEQLVANLVLEQPKRASRLRAFELPKYCEIAARGLSVSIAPNAPVAGRDAFRTGTGVHAAAILRAEECGEQSLSDDIYSAIPARMVGRKQEITVSFVSGASNVRHWLAAHGFEATEDRVAIVLERAKAARFTLDDSEILSELARIDSEKK